MGLWKETILAVIERCGVSEDERVRDSDGLALKGALRRVCDELLNRTVTGMITLTL